MKIGHARVSTRDQNFAIQIDALAQASCESQDMAGRDITDLVAKGVLVHEGASGRSTCYRWVPYSFA